MERTAEGKFVLFHARTGERIERWPIDARGMVASGEYVAAPLNTATSADSTVDPDALRTQTEVPPGPDTPDPVPHVTAAEAAVGALSPTGAPLVAMPDTAPETTVSGKKGK